MPDIPYMFRGATVLIVAAGVLASCTQNKVRVTRNPYNSGQWKNEPVFYNGKHYQVKFRYLATSNVYDASISGRQGRKLGGQPGDKSIVSAVVVSAVRHYGCARGQKAHIVPGTQRHHAGTWFMHARCQ